MLRGGVGKGGKRGWRMNICFIGSGNISEAIIAGLINSDRNFRKKIIATDIRPERLTYISQKFGIRVTDDNQKAVKQTDIIVIAVKPQNISEVLQEISCSVKPKQLIISVAAGISTTYIEKFFCKPYQLHSPSGRDEGGTKGLHKVPVIRVMPNTCAHVRESLTAICRGKYAKKHHEEIVVRLFSSIGKTIVLQEKYFDTITAVSGSGPAYVFYLTEAIILAAKKLGLDYEAAKKIAVQTVYGAGKLMMETGEYPEILRHKVTSPGGTTEQAIKYFQLKKFAQIVKEAIVRARKRSKELTKR
ncbi:MAG: pyrroline-5-carboxylate reductase [Elusimicrobiota bacterium]|nr:pyrroline-5-carboxylate reductase [Elusimicrobiota bacterium]